MFLDQNQTLFEGILRNRQILQKKIKDWKDKITRVFQVPDVSIPEHIRGG